MVIFRYHIGVAAIVDREPIRLSSIDTTTGTQPVKDLEQDMTVRFVFRI